MSLDVPVVHARYFLNQGLKLSFLLWLISCQSQQFVPGGLVSCGALGGLVQALEQRGHGSFAAEQLQRLNAQERSNLSVFLMQSASLC